MPSIFNFKVRCNFHYSIHSLRKRALIESVYDELKNICQIEHTRLRGSENFVANLISGLVAYSFFPKNPSMNLENIDNIALKRVG